MEKIQAARARVDERYRAALGNISGLELPTTPARCTRNHSYFPVRITREFPITRDALYDELRAHNIAARRYFYPLISEFPTYRGLPSAGRSNLPVASEISRQVLCLPIYPALTPEEQDRIVDIVMATAGLQQYAS
jgi:dTDP-4-amino-4,6-dideoxygalactose transaminase